MSVSAPGGVSGSGRGDVRAPSSGPRQGDPAQERSLAGLVAVLAQRLSRRVPATGDGAFGPTGADGLARHGYEPAALEPSEASVEVQEVQVLRSGRPGLLDVVATVNGSTLHLAIGLRSPGDEVHLLAGASDPVLGLYEDGHGLAVAVDALCDAEIALWLVEEVMPSSAEQVPYVRLMGTDPSSTRLAAGDSYVLTIFHTLCDGPNPGVELLVALDEAGFNHIPAPLARWRHRSWDLGLVQEQLSGASPGTAVAEASLRDLYEAGCDPAEAGGDFASEAGALGTMTARMHLALDSAFGRRAGNPASWAQSVSSAVSLAEPDLADRPDVVAMLEAMRALPFPCTEIRVHGDLHLGRVCRTEQGWYVWDLMWPDAAAEGRVLPGIPAPETTAGQELDATSTASPLQDVATMLWCLSTLAAAAAGGHDPADERGTTKLAEAWERRNRRAFLSGYLNVPGILGIVPPDRGAIRTITSALELRRAAIERLRSLSALEAEAAPSYDSGDPTGTLP